MPVPTYPAHALSSRHYTTHFVEVDGQMHVSVWRGHDMDPVRVMSKDAARVEWRRLIKEGATRLQSGTVGPLFHGLDGRRIPRATVEAAYAELAANAASADPRGPARKIIAVAPSPTGGPTLVTLSCGHVRERANHFAYQVGADDRCFGCDR